MKKLLLSILLLSLAWTVHAKEGDAEPKAEGEETQGRVQYLLILPEEKTPELVKAEENNPFEPSNAGAKKDEESSEENHVREILLQLPAVGGASGSQGMRVMLGGMRLVEGGMVPPVLPDQQVALKVKSISSSAIELLWVEKKPTGLPPKILTIPLDGAPKVRYQLPVNGNPVSGGRPAGSTMGSLRRNGVAVLLSPAEAGIVNTPRNSLPPLVATPLPNTAPSVASTPPQLPALVATPLPDSAETTLPTRGDLPAMVATPLPSSASSLGSPPQILRALAATAPPSREMLEAEDGLVEDHSSPVPESPAPSADVPEASVLRMLFGNHAPSDK